MFGRQTQPAAGGPNDPYSQARQEMIEQHLRNRGVVMHSVLEAMRAVPRELFVSHDYASRAYADEALPSQEGQTISQPYMVGIMTQELHVRPGHRVLELGTGTGYQTAVLAWLAGPEGCVYSIERVPALADFAQRRLGAMEIKNVRYFVGDGSGGWPRDDPQWDGERSSSGEPLFDRILVTAGAPSVPEPLLRQLKTHGIMIVPVGQSDSQMLMRVEKLPEGVRETEILECRFVPLVGAYAWDTASYERLRRERGEAKRDKEGTSHG
jgi:protein-L-isoaspartate(D-aspartate) O-methyltransferase